MENSADYVSRSMSRDRPIRRQKRWNWFWPLQPTTKIELNLCSANWWTLHTVSTCKQDANTRCRLVFTPVSRSLLLDSRTAARQAALWIGFTGSAPVGSHGRDCAATASVTFKGHISSDITDWRQKNIRFWEKNIRLWLMTLMKFRRLN